MPLSPEAAQGPERPAGEKLRARLAFAPVPGPSAFRTAGERVAGARRCVCGRPAETGHSLAPPAPRDRKKNPILR